MLITLPESILEARGGAGNNQQQWKKERHCKGRRTVNDGDNNKKYECNDTFLTQKYLKYGKSEVPHSRFLQK